MKKNLLISLSLLSLSILMSCNTKLIEYSVALSNVNVSINNNKAKKGEKFDAVISINDNVSSGYYLPSSLSKVISGNEELFVPSYSYKLKEDKKSADFSIIANAISGDIVIKLELENDFFVNEKEFMDAIGFVNIEYLQSNYVDYDDKSTRIDEMSPETYLLLEDRISSNKYYEGIVVKVGNLYGKYMRDSKTEDYYFVQCKKQDFVTPVMFGKTFLEMFIESGIKYSDFVFANDVFSYTNEQGETAVFAFDNKKMTKNYLLNINGNKSYEYTFAYKNNVPKKPESVPLVADEFNNIVSFNGVQFLQTSFDNITSKENIKEYMSSKTYRNITESENSYLEKIVRKHDDGSYSGYSRNGRDKEYIEIKVYSKDFVIPKTSICNIKIYLDNFGISYNDLEFDKINNTYSANIGDGQFIIYFLDKIVSKFTIFDNDEKKVIDIDYSYEEIIPYAE